MYPFREFVLQRYYKATGWNDDNLYSNLARSSAAVLDFVPPNGLGLSISKSPNLSFKTTYSMTALPYLNGSVGYIFSSCDVNVRGSSTVAFEELVDRFRVYDRPIRPVGKEEEWLAGQRVDTRDYLLFGGLYIPSGRLDALYSIRLSDTMQMLAAAISETKKKRQMFLSQQSLGPARDGSNLMLSLQHDVGHTCTEYTWSAEDSMMGVRLLHNFGKYGQSQGEEDKVKVTKRIEEEELMEGGLRGRISAGAELYFSSREKSGGVSTGLRFTTIPDATPPSFLNLKDGETTISQRSTHSSPALGGGPPTTITAVYTPLIGHFSGAYATRVSPELTMATRFDFNMYSYESKWTLGFEWWHRRPKSFTSTGDHHPRASEPQGVVKASVSTETDVRLMWEGRLRNVLVSLGVVSDLANRVKPIRAMGLELSYFSSEP